MRDAPARSTLCTLFSAVLATSTAGAQFARTGPEFQVNTYTTNTQGEPSVAVDGRGDFVVIWESFGQDGSGFGVFGRHFDKAGIPSGPEFQVNSYTTGNQYSPVIRTDPSGGFLILWESVGQDGSGSGVYGRRLDAAGSPQGGEFAVNTWTTGNQVAPSLAMDAWGNFVVAWGSDGQDGSGYGVFGRRFDRTGAPRGGEFQINTTTYLDQFPRKTSVASGPTGDFVVVWQAPRPNGTGGLIFGQQFDTAGARVGSEFQVNSYTGNRQRHPSIVMHPSGSFMVIWESLLQDTSSWGVYGQRFDPNGSKTGGEFQVNTETYSGQITGNLGVDDAGRYVVVWYSFLQDGSDQGIFGQRYEANGVRSGAEFQINSFTTGEQNLPFVGVDPAGRFVVAWYSFAQDGSDLGIFAQRYDCVGMPDPVADLDIDTPDLGGHLTFTWTDVAGASDYMVLEDAAPYGGFRTVRGTAVSGEYGYTVSTPASNLMFYRVAGRNAACGMGPMR